VDLEQLLLEIRRPADRSDHRRGGLLPFDETLVKNPGKNTVSSTLPGLLSSVSLGFLPFAFTFQTSTVYSLLDTTRPTPSLPI
jgi:hypothetical protein